MWNGQWPVFQPASQPAMFEYVMLSLMTMTFIVVVAIFSKLHLKDTIHTSSTSMFINPKARVWHCSGCHHIGKNAEEYEICELCWIREMKKKAQKFEKKR